MQSLANYRSMHMRMQQLAAEGALDGEPLGEPGRDRTAAGEAGQPGEAPRCAASTAGLLPGLLRSAPRSRQLLTALTRLPACAPAEMHAAAAGGIVAALSDLDGFTAKLNAILQADLTHAGARLGWPELGWAGLGCIRQGLGRWRCAAGRAPVRGCRP